MTAMIVEPSVSEVFIDGAWKMQVGRIRVNPGDTVIWHVGKDREATIWFGDPSIFGKKEIASKQSGDIAAVVVGSQPGVYEYSMYFHDEDQFAVGNSHPIVEIPRPGP